MLKPLEQWICDVCGDIIEGKEEGYVLWRYDEDRKKCDFKVVHKMKCNNCELPSSCAISDLLGEKGAVRLQSFISIGRIKVDMGDSSYAGVKDNDEFIDLYRRMQLPFYEEARLKFGSEEVIDGFSDTNEVYPYLPKVIRQIAEIE